MLNRKPVQIGTVKVSPLSLLLHLLPPPSQIAGKIRANAGILVEVTGESSGERVFHKLYVTMTHDEAYEKYRSNANSYLAGTLTAACALMLAKGRIENRGVIVPECLNAETFIEEARKFDLRVRAEKVTL